MAARTETNATENRDERSAHESTRTIAVQVIATIIIAGAAHLMPGLVVPLLIALVLAIVLSPLARRLESIGLPPTLASLLFTTVFGSILILLVGLFVYQINAIAGEMDEHLGELSGHLGGLTERAGLDGAMQRLGATGSDDATGADTEADPSGAETTGEEPAESDSAGSAEFWEDTIGQGLEWLGRWLAGGIGGLLGVVFGAVVGLIALFLMLRLRELWIERLLLAAEHIGLCPNREGLAEIRGQVVTYLGVLGIMATFYVVLVTSLLWFMEVPRPLLWGILSGTMEFIPIFGPTLSGTLITLATLMTTGTLWKAAVVAGIFITLNTLEGYVLWPVVFGKTIKFDQVTILVGLLFFAGLLGPLGMVLGMPLMILLRGFIASAPGTPALDAIVEVDGCVPNSV